MPTVQGDTQVWYRPGDNAPHAILELVDSPRNLRREMTSRAIGWEILKDKLKGKRPEAIINAGAQQTLDVVKVEMGMEFREVYSDRKHDGLFRRS